MNRSKNNDKKIKWLVELVKIHALRETKCPAIETSQLFVSAQAACRGRRMCE
jgi:hypothetical protein